MNSGGNSFPFGIFAPSCLSSSKKGWHIASTELSRASGVYSSNFETRSIDSGAVRGRNTCDNLSTGVFDPGKSGRTLENGCGLICGNLCSM